MSFRRLSVPRTLPWVPALVAVLVLGAAVVASEFIVGRELQRRAGLRVQQTAALYADQISRVLARRAAELELLTRTAVVQAVGRAAGTPGAADLAALRAELDRVKASSASFVWVGVTDLQGRVLAATDGLLEGQSIADRPVYARGREGLWFGSLHPPVALKPAMALVGREAPAEIADLGLPVLGPDGTARAVLAAHLDGRYFDTLRVNVLGAETGRRQLALLLLDGQGRVLLGDGVRPRADALRVLQDQPPGTPLKLSLAEGGTAVAARSITTRIDTTLQTDWQVVALQPIAAALEPVRAMQAALLLWGGAATLLIGAAGFVVSRHLARPYAELLDAVAQRIGAPAHGAPPADYLAQLAGQLRRLPAAASPATRGEQLLAQVVYDATRLHAMLDQLPLAVYLVDADERVVFWNRHAGVLFGRSAADAQGRPIVELLQGGADGPERRAMRALREPGAAPTGFEAHVRRPDGTDVWGEWHASRLEDPDGRFIGVLAQVRDLTAERHAELALREQSETLAAVIHSASDAVISIDEAGLVRLFNPAAERIFGHKADAMLGQPLDRLLPQRFRGDHMRDVRRFADSNITRRAMGAGRVHGVRADGTELELEASISQVTVRQRKVLTAILRDVTERTRAERALVQYQFELSELTQRLMEQEKVMTRRLAQTLHDRLGQTLAAMRLSFDAVTARMQGVAPPDVEQRARSIGQLIDQAIHEVRQALVELRPPLLESQGLVAAIDNELRARAPEAAPAALRLDADERATALRWPPDVEYAAFMIVREAIGNALRHADARSVTVRVDGHEAALSVEVHDDGRGLPPEAAAGRPGHLGMVGMRERALAIGAHFAAEAGRCGGTTIRLHWERTA